MSLQGTLVTVPPVQNIAEHARPILTLSDGRIVEESRPESVRDAVLEIEALPDAAGAEGGRL